jgi:hypothetical protein
MNRRLGRQPVATFRGLLKRWIRYLAKFPYWTSFRTTSNTPAARAVILIPLIGYWIIFNAYVADHTKFTRFLFPHGPATGHLPWRLFVMYFGLCLVSVASALYQWLASGG